MAVDVHGDDGAHKYAHHKQVENKPLPPAVRIRQCGNGGKRRGNQCKDRGRPQCKETT